MPANTQAYAGQPAYSDPVRSDRPFEMHRGDPDAAVQQSEPGGSHAQASFSSTESDDARLAPVRQAARLMGRRLKVSILGADA